MRTPNKLLILFVAISFMSINNLFSQTVEPSGMEAAIPDSPLLLPNHDEQFYSLKDGKILVYSKPRSFGFITNLPKDAAAVVSTTFRRDNINRLLLLGGTTVALLFADQPVSDGVQQFSRNIHFDAEERYQPVIELKMGKKSISIFKAPKNLNTAFYQMGQGFPSLLIGAGLFTYGKINHDYRAISTASQLAETFILMGVGTQLLKRISGRQSPSRATCKGGAWHFLPSFKKYQSTTPAYDAFPSGHLATLMSSVTILADNYPEKRYIRPVGYSLIGLVGLSMINTQVHWISDYPVALALGYVCARQVVKRNQKTITPGHANKNNGTVSYTFNVVNNKMVPGIRYTF